MIAATWVVILTFMVGPDHIPLALQRIDCRRYECVQKIIDHAGESRLLSRLRVFSPQTYAGMTAGMSFGVVPYLDLEFL